MTPVHIKHRAIDSTEHLAYDTGLTGDESAGTFGMSTEAEGGMIPKVVSADGVSAKGDFRIGVEP